MEIQVEKRGEVRILGLIGEMDMYTSYEFRENFNDYYAEGIRKYIFDLSGLTYIDSTGIGTIIATFTSLRKQNGELYVSGVHGVVKRVIEFTKLNSFLPLVPDKKTALQKMTGMDIPVDNEDVNLSAHPSSDLRGILQNDSHPLFEKKGMYHKDFNLDLKKVRYLSQIIVQKAPAVIREINLLEQQVSEIIKNAVRHGNKNNPNKKVKIWFSFDEKTAHLIVEDEGDGFLEIDTWNNFYRKKQAAFESHDFEEMLKYVSFRTKESTEDDGGNALFAAVEFWNEGVVFNRLGNAVAVKRVY